MALWMSPVFPFICHGNERENYILHTTSRTVDTLDLSEKTFPSREEVRSSITLVLSFQYPRETRGWICLLEAYASIFYQL